MTEISFMENEIQSSTLSKDSQDVAVMIGGYIAKQLLRKEIVILQRIVNCKII